MKSLFFKIIIVIFNIFYQNYNPDTWIILSIFKGMTYKKLQVPVTYESWQYVKKKSESIASMEAERLKYKKIF